MDATYDIVSVGGGLAGALAAGAMAERGLRVLVLERETRFRDRVRGEGLLPWGAAELAALGVRERLLAKCATENRWWDDYLGVELIGHRDTVTETPGSTATMTFFHPQMQEELLAAAADAGAEVRRGCRVTGIVPGRAPAVLVEQNGRAETVATRLVVAADGRGSAARGWAGFSVNRDPPRLRVAGVLFEAMTEVPEGVTRMVINPELGQSAILFPQGDGRVRAYVIFASEGERRYSVARDTGRFLAEAARTGLPEELLAGAEPAGPLATFEGADSWVDHPYRDGVALVGDAAATCDPSWGQGLSLAVHDVRLLRDALLSTDDWTAAGRRYAAGHDRAYATIRTTEAWFTTFFLDTGPEADARRAVALPLIAAEPDRLPDAFMSGPDAAPADERARMRFFGEL